MRGHKKENERDNVSASLCNKLFYLSIRKEQNLSIHIKREEKNEFFNQQKKTTS